MSYSLLFEFFDCCQLTTVDKCRLVDSRVADQKPLTVWTHRQMVAATTGAVAASEGRYGILKSMSLTSCTAPSAVHATRIRAVVVAGPVTTQL